MPRLLTVKQERFIHEYLRDPTRPAEAYKRAGYAARHACRAVHRLLRHPVVSARIREARDRLLAETGLETADIVRRLMTIANDPATDTSAGIHALDRAAKITGLYDRHLPRVEHGRTGEFERMDDATLTAEIERYQRLALENQP